LAGEPVQVVRGSTYRVLLPGEFSGTRLEGMTGFRDASRYNGFMITLIESKRAILLDLCCRFGVRRLELFGSAATGAFDPAQSDLDFLVEFLPEQQLGPWLRHYFEFQSELAQLFGRPVDLVLSGAVRNPYFRRELDRTRTVLYAA
jgi:predicted nucleotidyltransferase